MSKITSNTCIYTVVASLYFTLENIGITRGYVPYRYNLSELLDQIKAGA